MMLGMSESRQDEIRDLLIRIDERLKHVVTVEALDARLEVLENRWDAKLEALDERKLEPMRSAIARIEASLAALSATLNATLPHLATKAELAEKPSKAYMWGIVAVIIAVIGMTLAALSVLGLPHR